VEGKRLHDAGLRLVAGEAEAARARFAAAPVPPSVVLHEGTRVTAVWPLEQAVPVSPARLLLTRLAALHGGDRELADPDHAWLALPGSTVTSLFPRFVVRAEAGQPAQRVAIEAIGRWLGA